jgi:conjugal transfer pilus assembly protein TraB
MSARAVGDISSEKVYLDGVLMTCAKDKNTFMEIPVKAYITSMAKSGIRGEVISRDGDLVLRSFLAGIASGFGSSVNSLSQPQAALSSGGFAVTDKQKAKDIMQGSLGSGLSQSGDRLSDYFIKRAEQYQPVISVNEGVEVYVVFQEGFSFKEEEDDDKKYK